MPTWKILQLSFCTAELLAVGVKESSVSTHDSIVMPCLSLFHKLKNFSFTMPIHSKSIFIDT